MGQQCRESTFRAAICMQHMENRDLGWQDCFAVVCVLILRE